MLRKLPVVSAVAVLYVGGGYGHWYRIIVYSFVCLIDLLFIYCQFVWWLILFCFVGFFIGLDNGFVEGK